jgi:hypothetical protein
VKGDLEWFEAVDVIRAHVVRIQTPQGSGTGFLFARSANKSILGIATAAHVVDHAHYWEQPIRIQSAATGQTALLRVPQRAILLDEGRDTAAIAVDSSALTLPDEPLPLITSGNYLKVGNTIGWLGYPAISASNLCFFTGAVSAWIETNSAYLVDGVAINGVSGGPAFVLMGSAVTLMGVVSAYMPNRATGETLPGLGIVRDVAQLQDLIEPIKSLDEAKAEETAPAEPPPPIPSPAGDSPVPSSSSRIT